MGHALTVEEGLLRFWRKVDREGPVPAHAPHLGRCWLWLGSRIPKGYGNLSRQGQHILVHRYAYEATVGPIPEGLVLDHLCRVRHCVNPEHLEPVTGRENTLRGVSPSAIAAQVTHCPFGHEYTPENTYTRPNGARVCRECGRRRGREHYRQHGRRDRRTQPQED